MDAVQSFFVTIYRNKRAFVGFVILSIFILTAAIGPMVCRLDLKTDFARRYLAPSFEHLLGTDYVGRDLLVQLVTTGSRFSRTRSKNSATSASLSVQP
jgi:peptide/nickel transport system permease protein